MTKTEKDSTESSNVSTQEVLSQSLGEPPRNKGGRPKGSKNTLTLLQEAAKEGIMTEVLHRFDSVVKTTINKAEEGDPTCLKILWDRVLPAMKATDGSANQSNSGITIVVQGTKVTQQENSTIEDGEVIEG